MLTALLVLKVNVVRLLEAVAVSVIALAPKVTGEAGANATVWFAAVPGVRTVGVRVATVTLSAGDVTIVPRGLVYRSPAGGATVWSFDRVTRRYLEQTSIDLPPPQARN